MKLDKDLLLVGGVAAGLLGLLWWAKTSAAQEKMTHVGNRYAVKTTNPSDVEYTIYFQLVDPKSGQVLADRQAGIGNLPYSPARLLYVLRKPDDAQSFLTKYGVSAIAQADAKQAAAIDAIVAHYLAQNPSVTS